MGVHTPTTVAALLQSMAEQLAAEIGVHRPGTLHEEATTSFQDAFDIEKRRLRTAAHIQAHTDFKPTAEEKIQICREAIERLVRGMRISFEISGEGMTALRAAVLTSYGDDALREVAHSLLVAEHRQQILLSEADMVFVRPFYGAEGLRVAGEHATDILQALGPADEGHEIVLPALRYLDLHEPLSMDWPLLDTFSTQRRLAGHPVHVSYYE